MTGARYSEELRYNQKCGDDYHHIEERGHKPHDEPDEGCTGQCHMGSVVRKKTPRIRYPATEFYFYSNRASDRDVAQEI
jgi:hypothetical protein